jgi:hypothetical protein
MGCYRNTFVCLAFVDVLPKLGFEIGVSLMFFGVLSGLFLGRVLICNGFLNFYVYCYFFFVWHPVFSYSSVVLTYAPSVRVAGIPPAS